MKVYSIPAYGTNRSCKPNYQTRVRAQEPAETPLPQGDSVSFKSKRAAGAAIGGLLGVAAITFISGGLAAPFIVGAYAAGGAALGDGIGKLAEDDKDKKAGNG